MRTASWLPSIALVALAAGLASPGAGAASLFTATVGATTDQDPLAAAATGSFTNSFSTDSWSGSAVADGGGVGTQLVLTVGSSSTYAFTCGQNACTVVNASASSSDVVRITPTGLAPVGTPIDLRFDVTLDGSVVGNGGWSVQASGNAGNGNGVGYNNGTGGTVGAYNLAVHQVMSFTRTFLVGTNYSLGTSLTIGALMRGIGPQPYGIDVDFLDTLTIRGFVLSGGVGPLELIGDSGRDYLVAQVPLPAAGWLLFTGLGAVAALRRRISLRA
ncbi:MAG: VPLPA-CTERM sorting domain-containing protein [Gammaproteobacteria bacterium]|nr:VPLPA-CTERM sorting domain-containing protein [Gammaproteobacteria bacterium]